MGKISGTTEVHFRRIKICLITAILLAVFSPYRVHADWNVTQTLPLKTGWNAVYLEACPENSAPDAVFQGLPVDKVLTYFPQSSAVQYIQEPSEIPWNQPGWHFWIPQTHENAFLRNLYALQANQAYLIRCTQDFDWQVTGIPKIRPFNWQPNGFNFTGFHIHSDMPVTFDAYLSHVDAFKDTYIYSLKSGQWVQAKFTDPIIPDQAYWIYSKGSTDFSGSLRVWLPSPGDSLWFTPAISELELSITNRSDMPLSFTLDAEDESVPLSIVTFSPNDGKTYTSFTGYTSQNPLEPGATEKIRFSVRRADMTAAEAKGMLKLSSNMGDQYFIPVLAEKINE